ncbi:MAG: D-alanyl-D-alanine carboxypeptidase [Christensenellaceae bacterium]|nr:D-alanyl-D-alanine carboxypeptidase [Christensenellaceae bacterium]
MKHAAKKPVIAILLVLLIMMISYSAFAAPEVDPEKTSALCKASMLVDATTGTVIYACGNASIQLAPASTTKILTAIVVLEKCNLSDEVTCGKELDGVIGSKAGLVVGETVTIKDLLYCMMLPSGNDAATVLAHHLGGEEGMAGFAALMNEKAAELGMTNSHFINAHGLDKEEHYSTAEDMAKATLYAMNNPTFMEIVGTKKYTVESNKHSKLELTNTNKLLYKADNDKADYTYPYTTGIKTGATPNAGSCMVASAKKDGLHLIALIYGTPSETAADKWSVCRYLFEYGFEYYTTMDLSGFAEGYTAQATVNNAIQADGSKGMSRISCYGNIPQGTLITIEKDGMSSDNIKAEFKPKTTSLEAPVYQGDVIGTIAYTLNGKVLYECEAIAAESALDTVSSEDPAGTITSIEKIDVEEKTQDITSEEISKVLWWVLGPLLGVAALLIVFLVIKTRGGFARSASVAPPPTYVNTSKSRIIEPRYTKTAHSKRRGSFTRAAKGSTSGRRFKR